MVRRTLYGFTGLIVTIGVALAAPIHSQTTGAQSMAGQSQGQSQEEAERVPNELLVKFAENVSENRIQEISVRLGVEVVTRMSGGSLVLVRFPYPETFDDIRRAFETTPGVVYAEPNYIQKIDPQPGTKAPDDGGPSIPPHSVEQPSAGGAMEEGGGPSISVPDDRKSGADTPKQKP